MSVVRAFFPFTLGTGANPTVSRFADGPLRIAASTFAITVTTSTTLQAMVAGIVSADTTNPAAPLIVLEPSNPLDLTGGLGQYGAVAIDAIVYGGEACGYVIEFSNGLKIYHAGDTNVFGDMAIIRELYRPDIAMLPIGDRFVMSPREAAYACNLLKPKTVIPMHFGTFPQLTGTPGEFKKLVPSIEVAEMKPGVTIGG